MTPQEQKILKDLVQEAEDNLKNRGRALAVINRQDAQYLLKISKKGYFEKEKEFLSKLEQIGPADIVDFELNASLIAIIKDAMEFKGELHDVAVQTTYGKAIGPIVHPVGIPFLDKGNLDAVVHVANNRIAFFFKGRDHPVIVEYANETLAKEAIEKIE